jgi:hypothetical protein
MKRGNTNAKRKPLAVVVEPVVRTRTAAYRLRQYADNPRKEKENG